MPSSRDLYLRLMRHVWPYRAALFGGVVAMAVGGLADAALVKLSGPLIDELFVHHNRELAILLPLGIIAVEFPGREIVGIHSVDLVWGLGTIHCLTQQQPSPRIP